MQKNYQTKQKFEFDNIKTYLITILTENSIRRMLFKNATFDFSLIKVLQSIRGMQHNRGIMNLR